MIEHNQIKVGASIPTKLFTKAGADEILGSLTHLTDSVVKKEASVSSYLCGYKGDKKDQQSGKFGAIYFLFETYKDINRAKKRFSDVYISNKPHGAEAINSLGDEALYHTDHQNFDLTMVRKGRYVFNIKVNKRTSTTTFTTFKKTVKRIAEQI